MRRYSKWATWLNYFQLIFHKWNFEQVSFSWTGHVIFYYSTFKCAITFFLMKNRALAEKEENFNPAQKMVEKFEKSWIFLNCQVNLVTLLTHSIVAHSFTRERLQRSALIICLIVTKYFYH